MSRKHLALATVASLLFITSPAHAGAIGRAFTALRNAPNRIGRKLELATLSWKAKTGLLRENQLLKLKTRNFHTEDGGQRRERVLVTVENGHVLREATVYRNTTVRGESNGGGTTYNGNARRVFGALGRTIAASLADPDFKAASTDPAAKARFDARQAERQRRLDSPRTVPHRFVDGSGRVVTLKKVDDVE